MCEDLKFAMWNEWGRFKVRSNNTILNKTIYFIEWGKFKVRSNNTISKETIYFWRLVAYNITVRKKKLSLIILKFFHFTYLYIEVRHKSFFTFLNISKKILFFLNLYHKLYKKKIILLSQIILKSINKSFFLVLISVLTP